MKPLTPDAFLHPPLATLLAAPSARPQDQTVQHDAWVAAFDQALRHDRGRAWRTPDLTTTPVGKLDAMTLMDHYEQRVSQPLGRTAPVEALIQHLDRSVADPSITWSVACDALYARVVATTVHTYRNLPPVLAVLEHWLAHAPDTLAASTLIEPTSWDPGSAAEARLAQILREATVNGHLGQRQAVFQAWTALDEHEKPSVTLRWAFQEVPDALRTVWGNQSSQAWADAFAYGVFNNAPNPVMARVWACLPPEDQILAAHAVEAWIFTQPMDDAEEDEAPEYDHERLLMTLQRREELRDIVPPTFWQTVPSVLAHLRQAELTQRPATPRRNRPRA